MQKVPKIAGLLASPSTRHHFSCEENLSLDTEKFNPIKCLNFYAKTSKPGLDKRSIFSLKPFPQKTKTLDFETKL